MKRFLTSLLSLLPFVMIMLLDFHQQILEQVSAADNLARNPITSAGGDTFETYSLNDVRNAIAAKDAKWLAEENWLTRLSMIELQGLFSVDSSDLQNAAGERISIERNINLPSHFDWRENKGDWLTPVKNQGLCSASYIFAVLAMTESWWEIDNNSPNAEPDFSEQFLLSCADVDGCEKGRFEELLEHLQTTGVPPEDCFPYRGTDTVPCEEACQHWEDQAIKIPGWGWVTDFQNDVQLVKSALLQQPLLAWLWIYKDFISYQGGIYERASDEVMGIQAVLLVGWDDADEYWICKNSWGEEWGEKGYVRIKWGECALGQNVLMIYDEYADASSLSWNPEQMNVTLAFGEATNARLELQNTGTKNIVCRLQSYASSAQEMFRVNDYMAYDSLSWHYGIPEIERYQRTCLSFLDLPELDLTTSDQPMLSFMTQWFMCLSRMWRDEEYSDGFNVWICKNAGKTFQLLQPSVGIYNTNSLVPLAMYCRWTNSPWYLETDLLSGWADIRPYWHLVEFDLSSYKSAEVLIRISCLSSGDRGLFVLDDVPPQYGAFLDEIYVKDGDDILFENHGQNFDGCTRMCVSFDKTFDWLRVDDNPIELSVAATTALNVHINSRYLEPGLFRGFIGLTTNEPNDSSHIAPADYYIPVNLQIVPPERDIAVLKIVNETAMPCVGLPNKFGVLVQNIGAHEITDVRLECKISTPNMIYLDTLTISGLKSQERKEIYCPSLVFRETGEYNISIQLLPHSEDANDFNDQCSAAITVGNMINNFDVDSCLWICSGGFGITEKMNARSVPMAAHVNGGQAPYADNMDAMLSLQQPIQIGIFPQTTLAYWVRGMSEADKDILTAEVSGDGENWQIVDAVSGSIMSWQQRQVNVSSFITSDSSRLWLRFHFISDDQKGLLGFVIDDVEIVEGVPTSV
ncbi:MAG: hypothetical protein EHM72_18095, partial [Calditrichaeota bacterium]